MPEVTTDALTGAITIALSVLFAVMGVLHFIPTTARGMAAIIPPRLHGKGLLSAKSLVRFTGVCELAGAIGLLIPALHTSAALALVVFLIAVFPANVYASRHPEKFGRAAIPFWPRLILQLVLIALLLLIAF